MKAWQPFWHPLSALTDPELGTFCSPALIRLPIRLGQRVVVHHAGDSMRPAVAHGARIELEPLPADGPRRGDLVVADCEGVPELLRVTAGAAAGFELRADADPRPGRLVAAAALLARARLAPGRARARAWRRLRIEIAEALRHAPDGAAESADPAATVRDKYDAQAAHYAGLDGALDARLLERLGRPAADGASRVLVAGCGSGHECFALARAGWSVRGLDFAAAMVEQASAGAARRGLDVEFVRGDLRSHEEPGGSLDAVLFTYDVYSFLPGRAERVALLRRLERWLAPGGVCLLSARRVLRPYERAVLTLQWLGRAGRGDWGASHTRYVTADGKLRRSFVHYFTQAGLRREVESAGLRIGPWHGGHAGLSRPESER